MCGLIWDLLPGPKWLKFLQVVLIIFLIIMACFWWLFPWISQTLDLTGTTVGSPRGYSSSQASWL